MKIGTVWHTKQKRKWKWKWKGDIRSNNQTQIHEIYTII